MRMIEKLVDARNTVEGKVLSVLVSLALVVSTFNLTVFSGSALAEEGDAAGQTTLVDANQQGISSIKMEGNIVDIPAVTTTSLTQTDVPAQVNETVMLTNASNRVSNQELEQYPPEVQKYIDKGMKPKFVEINDAHTKINLKDAGANPSGNNHVFTDLLNSGLLSQSVLNANNADVVISATETSGNGTVYLLHSSKKGDLDLFVVTINLSQHSTCTVTYDLNGGEKSVEFESLEYTVKKGESTPRIADPKREGYTFAGWGPTLAQTVEADVVYVAQWTPIKKVQAEIRLYRGHGDDLTTYTHVATRGSLFAEMGTDQKIDIEAWKTEFDQWIVERGSVYSMYLGSHDFYTTLSNSGDPASNVLHYYEDSSANVFKFFYKERPEVAFTFVANEGGKIGSRATDCTETQHQQMVYPATGEVKRVYNRPSVGYKFANWTDENGNVVSTSFSFKPEPDRPYAAATYYANFEPDYTQRHAVSYKVEYYKDGELVETVQDETTQSAEGWIGETVSLDAVVSKEDDRYVGYKLDNTSPALPQTFTIAAGTETQNPYVIKVFYVKDDTVKHTVSFAINYYKDGTFFETVQGASATGWIGEDTSVTVDSAAIDTSNNRYAGYVLKEIDPVIIPGSYTVAAGAQNASNVINVYYVKNNDAKHKISYRVEYYQDGKLFETVQDEETQSAEGWIGEPTRVAVKSDIALNDRYVGYKLAENQTFPGEFTIAAGEATGETKVIRVDYIKDDKQTHALNVHVQYFLDGSPVKANIKFDDDWNVISDDSLLFEKTAWINDAIEYRPDAAVIAPTYHDRFPGYVLKSADIAEAYALGAGERGDITKTVDVHYVTRTEFDGKLVGYSEVYDGEAHGVDYAALVNSLAEGESIVAVQADGSFIAPENAVRTDVTYDANGNLGASEVTFAVLRNGMKVWEGTSTVEIRPASVTISANDAGKVAGTTDPELTVSVSDMVNDEDANVLTYTIERAAGEAVGTYPIELTGDQLQGNYLVSFQPGMFTITAAPVIPPAPVTPAPATPAPVPGVVPVAPVAATPMVIPDVATPLAGPTVVDIADGETAIEDDATPMSAFDKPHCWVHWLMLVGILFTVIYGAVVVWMRLRQIREINDDQDRILGRAQRRQHGQVTRRAPHTDWA